VPDPHPGTGRLTGTTAVVTGASRGIGLAIARRLHETGAHVAMIARTAATLRAESASLGPRVLPVACDLANAAAVADAVDTITGVFGGAPNVLVNNAGAFALTPVDALEPGDFAAALDVNLVAPFRLIHAFLPSMKARRVGHIVTIGSVADRAIFPGNAGYAPSKYGARALHEVLRLETRGSGVRATLVSPAQVDTSLWDAIDPDNREGFTPRAEMLRPDAVADAVLYALTQPADVNVDELRLSSS
jgi:NADP-dependent 3-hydroxy acid dehydrogenase YdfG